MMARKIDRPDGYPAKLRAPGGGPAHRVVVDGPDFAARCGDRWSRTEDGEVLPDHYTGERCATCEAA